MEKKTMSVIAGLDYLLQFIKASAIYKEAGKSPVWFSQRYHEGDNRGAKYTFSEADINSINEALPRIGERLQGITIRQDGLRDDYIKALREVLNIVKPAHLRDDVLQVSDIRWHSCTTVKVRTEATYRFSEEEVNAINQTAKNLGMMLQTIQLANIF